MFDSFNGSAIDSSHGKEMRCAITSTSPHLKFWQEVVHVLETVRFISPSGREHVPPTIRNWLTTVRGMRSIWFKLKKAGFKFVSPRNFNQDPAENFSGNIRSHGVRNINPTCAQFKASYKSLIVNNFVSPHSPGFNCEKDDNDGALSCLKSFLTSEFAEVPLIYPVEYSLPDNDGFTFSSATRDCILPLHAYLAGYLARRILKLVGVCAVYRRELTGNPTEHLQLIKARDYRPKSLLRPGTKFVLYFNRCNDVLHYFLSIMCVETNLGAKMKMKIQELMSNEFSCQKHDIFNIFYNLFVKFYIHTWTHNIRF